MRALFNRHQRRDKGFGPALGPTAATMLARLAAAAGARVVVGRSDWRLAEARGAAPGSVRRMGDSRQRDGARASAGREAWAALRLNRRGGFA